MNDIPIIGEQKPPTFPQVNVQFFPDARGAVWVVQLGPTLSIQQFMDAVSMNAVEAEWRNCKQQAAMVLQAVKNSRNGG